METITILLRLAIVFICAFIFGFERQRSHKPVGFGTFIFVALGSCGVAITATLLSKDNPLPLLGATITGIGFLGAGALIKTTDKIFGFTTAASVWIFSIFGLIIGTGEYIVGAGIYALIWIVIFFDTYLENHGIGSHQTKITIIANQPVEHEEIYSVIGFKRTKIVSMDINKKDSRLTIIMYTEGSKDYINEIPNKLLKKPWVDSFKIE